VQDTDSARVVLANAGFTEQNAVFASHPLLWGLKLDPILSPEDEVIPSRRVACDLAIPPLDLARRAQCYRASAGHPNVEGASRYAAAILAALGTIT
jgi:hypothetical protein